MKKNTIDIEKVSYEKKTEIVSKIEIPTKPFFYENYMNSVNAVFPKFLDEKDKTLVTDIKIVSVFFNESSIKIAETKIDKITINSFLSENNLSVFYNQDILKEFFNRLVTDKNSFSMISKREFMDSYKKFKNVIEKDIF